MSLGAFTPAVPIATNSPAVDQPIMLQNNQTLAATYGSNHVPLGADVNAGAHSVVQFAPQSATPAQIAVWQLYALATGALQAAPPTGTGIAFSLASGFNSKYGSYWTHTITVNATLSILVTYIAPLGSNTLQIYITMNYSAAAYSGSALITVPFQDPSGNQLTLTPLAGYGVGGMNSTYGNAIGLPVYPTASGSSLGVYTQNAVIQVGKSATASAVSVSSYITCYIE